MQAYSQPLTRLQTEASRFLRDRSLRLFHVVADTDLHGAVVELLAGQELRLDNRSPFVILEEPHTKADPGWERRTHTAWRQHERRRIEMAENGEALGELPEPTAAKGLLGLAELLGRLLVVRPEDTEGLVVLLAPERIEAPDAWQESIGTLLSLQGFSEARFIVVDRERCSIPKVMIKHEGCVLTTSCRIEGESPQAVLAGALDEDLLRYPGPIGARPKGMTPPRRVDAPPVAEPDPSAALQLEVTRNVLLGSVAMGEGRVSDGVAYQRRARDVSVEAQRIEQGVMMELVLGGYLGIAGAGDQAEQSYQRAAATAEAAGLLDKAAMAHLALGSSRLTRGDRTGALVAYARASTIAEQAGQDVLALQACHLTGDVARDLRMEPQAITFWARAIEIAERDPATAPMTSAGLAALELALLCRKRGQHHHAAQLLAKAEALSGLEPQRLPQGEPGAAPVVAPTPARPRDAEPREEVPLFAASTGTLPLAPGPATDTPLHPTELVTEGTEELTWAELEALHWGHVPSARSEPPAGPEVVHVWSEVEQQTLRMATAAIVSEDTTELLSQEELRAIRGETELPPTMVVAEVDRTPHVEQRAAEPAKAPAVPTIPPESIVVDDETELLSIEQIRRLQAHWAERRAVVETPRPTPPRGEGEEER
jgi:tetratricopeptide (TPR) repeat protein